MRAIASLALALAAISLVGGCGVARSNQIAAMPPERLASLSDRDICLGLAFNKASAALQAEAAKRQLGDCTEDHLLCVAWGNAPGTAGYAQCRSDLLTNLRPPWRQRPAP